MTLRGTYKMVEKLVKKPIKKDKKVLTMFIMIVPSLLIALTSVIVSKITQLSFQVLLLFFQLVIFKNLLDDYYGYDNEE